MLLKMSKSDYIHVNQVKKIKIVYPVVPTFTYDKISKDTTAITGEYIRGILTYMNQISFIVDVHILLQDDSLSSWSYDAKEDIKILTTLKESIESPQNCIILDRFDGVIRLSAEDENKQLFFFHRHKEVENQEISDEKSGLSMKYTKTTVSTKVGINNSILPKSKYDVIVKVIDFAKDWINK